MIRILKTFDPDSVVLDGGAVWYDDYHLDVLTGMSTTCAALG